MLRLIAVEPELVAVKNHLAEQGYDVVVLSECVRPIEAVVYTGQPLTTGSQQQGRAGNTVLINAAGLTPEEVVTKVEEGLG